jgi:dTDP-4-amino-4,6-dideoxygalactose transaminase
MIPFLDLAAQHAPLAPELEAAVARVIRGASFVLGPEVEAFEAELATFCGTRFAVAVSSGTAALHLGLLAAGIGPGDEVITTSMTFVATVAAILYAGATPVLVDIDPRTRNLDPTLVARAVTAKTRAIVPVHLHGAPVAMDEILALADAHGLIVVEDAAQAIGAEYLGRRVGSLGDLGCFSFYPGKNLGACGEGGAIVTDNSDLAVALRRLRDWGQSEKYRHEERGFNYRMDAIQAACLRVKLPHLSDWIKARRTRARWYDQLLSAAGVALPEPGPDDRHVYHVYAVEVPDRDEARRRLQSCGIATGIHYPAPVHLQPAYAEFGRGPGSFPNAERFASRTLSLPLYPELTRAQVEAVAEALTEKVLSA